MKSRARIGELLDIALEFPTAERESWLCSLSSEDAVYRERLSRLLARLALIERRAFLSTLPKLESADDGVADVPEDRLVGPYRLLRKLGSGGMGSVWLAERVDGVMRRPVALKLPLAYGMNHGGFAGRMAREREICASLNHPHIARLYDAGQTSSGQPYLAFEFVEGKTLDKHCQDRCLSIEARLKLFLQVCAAVSHAHANLIVHRDLKPGNILVTPDEQVRLLDFGIARLLSQEPAPGTNLSQLWGRVLTPDYAAPEQFSGDAITIRSDIFSLGTILYELIADRHPYAHARLSRRALEEAIRTTDPPRIRDGHSCARHRDIKPDLEAIVFKALRKSAAERYQTVDAFSEDISRFLSGRPVAAQKDGAAYRLRKLIGRHRLAIGAAVVVLIMILATAGIALRQRHTAILEAGRAKEVKAILTQVLVEASPYSSQGTAKAALDLSAIAQRQIDGIRHTDPALRVELLTIVGTVLLNQQNTNLAERVLQRAVDEAQLHLDPRDPLAIRARVGFLPVNRFRGRTHASRRELASLLPVLRANPQRFAEELVIALQNEVHLDIDDGKYASALRVAAEASQVVATWLGPEHPEAVTAELMMALVLQYTGDPQAALARARQALEIAQHRYPQSSAHPRVIEAQFLLGRALGGAGRYGEAVAQIGLAVQQAIAVFGPSGRKVGTFLVDLARFQLLAGDAQSALVNSERALAIVSRHSSADSGRLANALSVHGRCLLATNRIDEGSREMAHAAEILTSAHRWTGGS